MTKKTTSSSEEMTFEELRDYVCSMPEGTIVEVTLVYGKEEGSNGA